MGYRSIFVQSAARVSVRRAQLVILTDAERQLPLEDVDCLLLEDPRSTVTAAALAACAEAGVTVFICDTRHMPCGVFAPWNSHSRQYAVMKDQLALTLPAKKRLWQQLVRRKIENQARCLQYCRIPDAAAELQNRAAVVQSGDATHQESAAAARYFPALFGPGFTRGNDCTVNAGLNYGYAILRGHLARLLAGYGFLPAIGLNHSSELNAFNLADDLIEPYRPLVDLFVATQIDPEAATELSPALKHRLLETLHIEVLVDGKRQTAAHAMELTVQSLRRACCERSAVLQLPELTGTELHRYE